jgi:ribonuclease-3 family protein
MNEHARKLVNASAQAAMYKRLREVLSDEELNVIKRGRNANTKTVPKNAAMTDYRLATGLESLFGYLYMANRTDRIRELFEICTKGA